MNIRFILLLILILVLSNVAAAMNCPNATERIKSYFKIQVDLIYGKNTTCSDDQEIHFRDTINDAMTNLNLTKAGGPSRVIEGDICIDLLHRNLIPVNSYTRVGHGDHDVLIRNLLAMNSYTWVGRAGCQSCSPDKKLRRLGEQHVAAEEQRVAARAAARLASIDLTNLIIMNYVDDEDSCLHDDWATVVVVSVTEITQGPADPCL